ncbi:uncharacterized protein LOC100180192 [Ciona intestinalis]
MDKVQAAVKIQSYWRGYNTRKLLLHVHKLYQDILFDIDGRSENDNDLFWSGNRNLNSISRCVIQRPMIQKRLTQITNESNLIEHNSQYCDTISVNTSLSMEDETDPIIEDVDVPLNTSSDLPDQNLNGEDLKNALLNRKRDITLELLWAQQAIESRVNYLTVKQNMLTDSKT